MGAEQMKEFYPGLKAEQLPGGLGWAVEFLTLTTHSGTHLDAPYHYHPTMDEGQRIPEKWRSQGYLGSPFCRHRYRLLSYGENGQSGFHRQTLWV